MTFNELQAEICTFLSTIDSDIQVDEIKSETENNDFDFANLIGTYFSIGTYQEFEYKDSIPVTITLVSSKNNKVAVRDLANDFDKKVNKAILNNCRIVRQNSYVNSFVDEQDLYNLVLSYFIYKFN